MRVPVFLSRGLPGMLLLVLLAGLTSGCHNNGANTAITVSVSPGSATVALQGTEQFTATLTNATDDTVTWQVNKVTGGTTTCGTISANGLYTAPSVLPSSTACSTITITAISNEDTAAKGTATITLTSGITITITPTGTLTMGTGEHLSFFATVNGTGTNFVNTVNWLVSTVQGGSSTTGTICMIGTGPDLTVDAITPVACNPTTPGDGTTAAIYYAPSTIPTTTITIEAESVADNTQTASATITLSAAAPPTVSSISPTLIPQGAIFQDLYLTGTNFLSTTTVTFDGQPMTEVAAPSSTVLRVRVPGYLPGNNGQNLLGIAGVHTVVAAQQVENGQMGGGGVAETVTVVPVRPAALTPIPPTFIQQSPSSNAAPSLELDGGYYTQSTTVSYNGFSKSSALVVDSVASLALNLATTISSIDPRRISATIGGIANDVKTAGLFQASVTTPNATPSRAAVNVTVTPTYIAPASPPMVVNTIKAPGQLSAPVALGYDEVLGIPVVVNKGNNTLALLDSAFTTVTASIPVGTSPTGVAVDNMRHAALVADNGSSDVQAVDLVNQVPVGAPVPIPAGQGPPYAVAMDNVHGLGIVVGQNTSTATLLNTSGLPLVAPTIVGTVAVTTGSQPQVKVLPELGWAIITAGGTGGVTVVDLVRSAAQGSSVILSAFLTPTPQGIALDGETKTLLLTDPTITNAEVFRLTDQSTAGIELGFGNVAAAVNTFTDVGVVLNPGLQEAFILDLSTVTEPTAPITLGSHPIAVQFAADANVALVADDVDNTVSVISFNPINTNPTRTSVGDPEILQISCPAVLPMVTTGCPTIIVSGTATSTVPLTVIGAGFAPNAQIRLEGMGSPTLTTTFVNSRMLTAMIPLSLLNGGPRRIIVDVMNPSTGALSNVKNIYLLQAVPVGNGPAGVAVDVQRDVAVVANATDNTVSVVDINTANMGTTFGTVLATVTVGTTPMGVATLSRAGRVVVANSGESTASVIDLTTTPPGVVGKVTVGQEPTGVAMNEALGAAVVTSSGSNTVSTFDVTSNTLPVPSSLGTGTLPVAAGVAPDLGVAIVAAETGNEAQVLNVSTGTPSLITTISNLQEPFAVDYDPVSQNFLVVERAGNEILTYNGVTQAESTFRTGVDPSSLAVDFQSGTLLTLNTASNTMSVVDLPNTTVTDLLPLSGGTQYALAIHPRLGLVVVSDTTNNRILLMQVPR